jgi:hypothetical protein
MPDSTEHYNLQRAGAAGVQNKWALYDGNFDAIERGRTVKRLAGEALLQYDVVRIDPSTGKFRKAVNGQRPLIGLQIEDADLDTETYAQTEGPVTNSAWAWAPYLPVYAHLTTPGALTQTKDDTLFQPPIGLALSATSIYLFPSGIHLTADAFNVVKDRSIVFDSASGLTPSGEEARRTQEQGGDMLEARLTFDDSTPEVAWWRHAAHPAYQGSDLTARIRWRANTVSGDVRWELAWVFGPPGMAWDLPLTVVGTVLSPAASVAPTPAPYDLLEAELSITNPAHKPDAGDAWWLRLRRVAGDEGGTPMAGDAELVQVIIEYRVDE